MIINIKKPEILEFIENEAKKQDKSVFRLLKLLLLEKLDEVYKEYGDVDHSKSILESEGFRIIEEDGKDL